MLCSNQLLAGRYTYIISFSNWQTEIVRLMARIGQVAALNLYSGTMKQRLFQIEPPDPMK